MQGRVCNVLCRWGGATAVARCKQVCADDDRQREQIPRDLQTFARQGAGQGQARPKERVEDVAQQL